MISRNDPCWCASGKKWKQCHYPVSGKAEVQTQYQLTKAQLHQYNIILKSDKQIEGIRASCALAVKILNATCAMARIGVTTLELNNYAHQLHLDAGAIPAPLNYGNPPFPKSICTSLNEVICHGIPDKRPLQEGDIVNIDVTTLYKGYYGDCSRMVVLGPTTPERQLVVDVSYECLQRSVAVLQPGVPVSAIGEAIESCATPRGCSVVNQFVGHGVGVQFHEGPQIPHHRNRFHLPMVPGMTFTIEPMINAGVREGVIDPVDQWTARTRDGKPSAQFEYTLLIIESGCEILTPWDK